jgi:hypothetical protein
VKWRPRYSNKMSAASVLSRLAVIGQTSFLGIHS